VKKRIFLTFEKAPSIELRSGEKRCTYRRKVTNKAALFEEVGCR
jgi:hypothetical protein